MTFEEYMSKAEGFKGKEVKVKIGDQEVRMLISEGIAGGFLQWIFYYPAKSNDSSKRRLSIMPSDSEDYDKISEHIENWDIIGLVEDEFEDLQCGIKDTKGNWHLFPILKTVKS